MAASRLAAGAVCAATVLLAVLGVVLAVIEPAPTAAVAGAGGVALAGFEAFVYTTFAVLGAGVTARQPRNPIGWLLQVCALALAISTVSNHLYFHALLGQGEVTGVGAYATWVVTWIWILAIVPAFMIFPLLFPTGRPLSPRWRAVVWLAVIAGTVTFVGTAFAPGPLEDYPAVVNPVGIDSPAVAIVRAVGFAVLIPTAFVAIASLVVRFRRSAGTERQQLKWVATAATLLPVAFSGLGLDGEAGFAVVLCGLLVVAVAVAIAMLRYRLYDIDVVINRTLVYSALIAVLTAAYAGSVLVLQLALAPLTERSDLAVAGSTLVVAALFRPARARVKAAVDHRFYRSRYDAARTLDAFSGRLREQLDLEALSEDLRCVVRETVAPTHVSLWLRP